MNTDTTIYKLTVALKLEKFTFDLNKPEMVATNKLQQEYHVSNEIIRDLQSYHLIFGEKHIEREIGYIFTHDILKELNNTLDKIIDKLFDNLKKPIQFLDIEPDGFEHDVHALGTPEELGRRLHGYS